MRSFCPLAPPSLFRTPGPRQFLSLSQFLLLNQTEPSLSGNFIDRKDKQQGVLPLWVPMSDARFADSKKINVIYMRLIMDSQSLKMGKIQNKGLMNNKQRADSKQMLFFSVPVHMFFIFISHHEQIISQLSFCCHVYRE